MTQLNELEIHQIVQRVLQRTLGETPRADTATSSLVREEAATLAPQTCAGEHSNSKRVVAIGADHGGFELKESLKTELVGLGFEVRDMGTNSKEAVDYPDYAHAVAQLVGTGKAWRGIMIDGAGIGSCIVANKVPGVRAGMAYDYSSALNSREHNDTNVLTLGAGLIGANLAKQIVQTWLKTEFGGGRHTPRLEKIKSVEKQYLK